MSFDGMSTPWIDGIDVSECHCIDFDTVATQDIRVVIVRAGRGTRQDARWIEHVRAARLSGLAVGSYWHVYPSHTGPHHQAELWAGALRGAAEWPFEYGHWADVSSTDGLDPFQLGRYVAAFLRRVDELVGHPVGVFTSEQFWHQHVHFHDPDRPRWVDRVEDDADSGSTAGIRTMASDRGGPGHHRVRAVPSLHRDRLRGLPHLVPRGPTEPLEAWQARWVRTPDVAVLQLLLNELGASLVVDGVFGPATDAAVRTCELLRRRDRFDRANRVSSHGARSAFSTIGRG
jgi:Glycosyl hydrolases family 25